jgi:hypothetical protein
LRQIVHDAIWRDDKLLAASLNLPNFLHVDEYSPASAASQAATIWAGGSGLAYNRTRTKLESIINSLYLGFADDDGQRPANPARQH